MLVYLDLVVLLNFLVDLLLIMGTNRLCGLPRRLGRSILAAGVGGLYAGACLLPGFGFLGGSIWRTVFLALMGIVAFGWSAAALRGSVLLVLLSMALGGVALGLGSGSFISLVTAAAVLSGLCLLGFRGRPGQQAYVQVELCRGSERVRLLALRDTGNSLRDPVTGRSVLVVDPGIGARLLGLTPEQLACPVETVASGAVPGLRLIPFRSVGNGGGLLPALRMEQVRIGSWQGSTVVAFAPQALDREGTYRALTGGMV